MNFRFKKRFSFDKSGMSKQEICEIIPYVNISLNQLLMAKRVSRRYGSYIKNCGDITKQIEETLKYLNQTLAILEHEEKLK